MKKNIIIIVLILVNVSLGVFALSERTKAHQFEEIASKNEVIAQHLRQLADEQRIIGEANAMQARQEAIAAKRAAEECARRK